MASGRFFCAAGAVWPQGWGAAAGMVDDSGPDGAGRVTAGILAVLFFAAVLSAVGHFRNWTVLELRDGVLAYTTPGLFRQSTSHFVLAEFSDAVMDPGEDGGVDVTLVPRDKNRRPPTLLGGPAEVYYRRSDLDFVARLLREAIAETRPEGVAWGSFGVARLSRPIVSGHNDGRHGRPCVVGHHAASGRSSARRRGQAVASTSASAR